MALGMGKAAAGTAATVASVGMGAVQAASAVGALRQGQAQRQLGEYNAALMEREARAREQKAAFDEKRQREQARQFEARQRLGAATSGGELLDFSDVIGYSAEQAEIDAMAIRYGGQVGASAARSQATMDRMSGRMREREGYYRAGSTLLTAAGNLGRLA